ncbi:peroxisomal succinyl-coenzyme A thioesterase-like isoform X1 [Syngnathus scovelli]|uniref:peroxisomal succinyl-coenzyme A thioesterase-like isoform X1 n=1 Tax=Syngnathus scovelli TaxID=161590 RepID=UPI00210FFEEE|nr:peroxisomal succinyl-coenzyme A thioesterase-like isoform X1 [Syngnathus scovelli]XP_049588866.1 peroxisomal succinyl-coenzyme A thioesterase-like isoform X1 [Syngnathus scovelli]XP_049588867.1 peroxisomal succinyl-coenzyme A thioesterase-like isoform X1 [Syngnathus scovelli]
MIWTQVRVAVYRHLIGKSLTPNVGLHRKHCCLHRAAGPDLTHLSPPAMRRISTGPAPVLTAAPARGLVDDPLSIKASFLPPYHPVTLCAQMRSEDGDLWEAFGHYNTSADGTVNLARDHSVGGSYLGREPMGLFWALQPAPGEREGLRLRKKNVEIPHIVDISLLEGHVTPRERASAELAVATTERWYMAPGVQRIDIRQNGVVGTLFLPPGPGRFPAMVDLWGMGGGLVEYRSCLFASRGFASFTVAFMEHKDLTVQLNVNSADAYMKKAFNILQDHPQIHGDRIGVIGLSYGVYLALRLATRSEVNPSCLVCINGPAGSNVEITRTFCKPKVSASDQRFWPRDDAGYLSFKDMSLPKNYSPGTVVELGNLACPMMYILGEDDQNCPSIENSNMIEHVLTASGKSHLYTCLSYPGAGHLIEPPYSPNARISAWRIKPEKILALWGGHTAPHAAAQEDSWKKILNFLDENLRA